MLRAEGLGFRAKGHGASAVSHPHRQMFVQYILSRPVGSRTPSPPNWTGLSSASFASSYAKILVPTLQSPGVHKGLGSRVLRPGSRALGISSNGHPDPRVSINLHWAWSLELWAWTTPQRVLRVRAPSSCIQKLTQGVVSTRRRPPQLQGMCSGQCAVWGLFGFGLVKATSGEAYVLWSYEYPCWSHLALL